MVVFAGSMLTWKTRQELVLGRRDAGWLSQSHGLIVMLVQHGLIHHPRSPLNHRERLQPLPATLNSQQMSNQKDRFLQLAITTQKSLTNQVSLAAERRWTWQFHSRRKQRSLHLRMLHCWLGLGIPSDQCNLQCFYCSKCQHSNLLAFH